MHSAASVGSHLHNNSCDGSNNRTHPDTLFLCPLLCCGSATRKWFMPHVPDLSESKGGIFIERQSLTGAP